MELPIDFIFSQSSLQDFNDCRRRFLYRYIQRVAWPAPSAEPVFEAEMAIQRGARFHHVVHQHLAGCPAERIGAALVHDPQLSHWWRNYLEYYDHLPLAEGGANAALYPEHTLITTLDGQRILAKYDLIIVYPSGKTWIIDWKTGGSKPGWQRRRNLAERWQTALYPWIITRAGHSLSGTNIEAEKIEMIYWFAEEAHDSERFTFSCAQRQDVENRLADVIGLILSIAEADFEKTSLEKKCVYCPYRSLCERGGQAGRFGQEEEDAPEDDGLGPNFDFSQVEELPYI